MPSSSAGRNKKSGKVILQTYSPNHYVYKFAVNGDYKHFYEKECNLREVTKFPPFTKIVRVLVSGESEADVARILQGIYESLKASNINFVFLNYMWAPVRVIKNMRRAQILIRMAQSDRMTDIYRIIDEHASQKVKIFVETNPNSLS